MSENSDKRHGQRWIRRVSATGAVIALGLVLTAQQALAFTHTQIGAPPAGQVSVSTEVITPISGLTGGAHLVSGLPSQLAILDALSRVVAGAAAGLLAPSPAVPVLGVSSAVSGPGLGNFVTHGSVYLR